ncbi:MAG TPA: hypothetical protein VK588_00320 [Chitinophagaceae bacterium]|nr:hypothetical protein [Chitinophagaceae bacterium]
MMIMFPASTQPSVAIASLAGACGFTKLFNVPVWRCDNYRSKNSLVIHHSSFITFGTL